jgi:hypothetical protein
MAAPPPGTLGCDLAVELASRAFNRAANARNANDMKEAIAHKTAFWDIYGFSQHCAAIQLLANELTRQGLGMYVFNSLSYVAPSVASVVVGGGGPANEKAKAAPLGAWPGVKVKVEGMVSDTATEGPVGAKEVIKHDLSQWFH